MPLQIKREKFRNKYYMVARENGKVKARRKWGKKFSKESAVKFYSAQKSFEDDKFITKLTNFYEVDDYSRRTPLKKMKKYMYVIKGIYGNKTIYAVSNQHSYSYPVSEARKEAWENFYYRFAESTIDLYDLDKGKDLVAEFTEKGKLRVFEGVRYYAPIPHIKTNNTEEIQ